MKDLYNEFFRVTENQKIQDKVMITRVTTTAISIILCLFVMAFSAYSYFSYNVASSSNIIQSANFEINVTVELANNGKTAPEIINNDGKYFTARLKADTNYKFTVEYSEESSVKTGFCSINLIGCDGTFYTEQLAKDIDGISKKIVFYIIPDNDTTIEICANWGTSSLYGEDNTNNKFYIENEKQLSIEVIPQLENEITLPDEETTIVPSTDTTKPEETTLAPTESTKPDDTTIGSVESTIIEPDTTKTEETTSTETTGTVESTTVIPETTKPEETTGPDTTGTVESTTVAPETTKPEETTTTETITTVDSTTVAPETTKPTEPTAIETTGALETTVAPEETIQPETSTELETTDNVESTTVETETTKSEETTDLNSDEQ